MDATSISFKTLKTDDKDELPTKNALLWLPETPDGKAALVKPLSWQNAVPKPKPKLNRRRIKNGAGGGKSLSKMAARTRPLFHFSPPSSLLGNVVGGALLKLSSAGEGPKSLKSKKRTSRKQATPGCNCKLTRRNRSSNRSEERESDRLNHPQLVNSLEEPRTQRATSATAAAAASAKVSSGRSSKQKHGKPRFKITSSTSRKKKPTGVKVATPGKNSSQRKNRAPSSANSRAVSIQNASGSAFLKHLDFRPIQDGDDTGCGLSGTDCGGAVFGAISDVNYEGWMESNASMCSSCTSQEDADISQGPVEVCDGKLNYINTSFCASEIAGNAVQTPNIYLGTGECCKLLSMAEASQTSSSDFQATAAKNLDRCHNKIEKNSLDPDDTAPASHSPESIVRGSSRHSSPSPGKGSRIRFSPLVRKIGDAGSTANDDELVDRELQEMMGVCGSASRSPVSPAGRGASQASAKCATPHVSLTLGAGRTPSGSGRCSNDCTTAQCSASQLSSDSASGTLSQAVLALDEVSRERVQQEFDQRLRKYLSMLCGDSTDSPATRRLQSRILRQRSRASISHIWSDLASRINLKHDLESGGEKMCVAASTITPPSGHKLEIPAASIDQAGEENYSFNKKEEPGPAYYDSRPAPLERPHSSPARDADLANPVCRIPTPSLRYLLKCAITSHQSQATPRQADGSPTSRFTGKVRRNRGDAQVSAQKSGYVGKQELSSKPPAWRAVPQTDRTAQTDGTGYECPNQPKLGISPNGNGVQFMASTSPLSLEVASFSPADVEGELTENYKKPRIRTATPGKKSSRSASQRKRSPTYRSSVERPSSTGNLASGQLIPGVKEGSPITGIRRTGSLKDTPMSKDYALCGLPPTPQGYKGVYSMDEVSSRVEADLEKYNAVMSRCRALLGQQDPEEESSSSWTHSSDLFSVNAKIADQSIKTGDCTTGQRTLRLDTGGENTAPNQSMGDISSDAKEFSAPQIRVPTAQTAEQTVAKPSKLTRSYSAQGPRNGCSYRCAIPLKRSSSNPHYMGIVEFGSVDAIKRLVEPPSGQGKHKVSFDIDSDKSVASAVSGFGGTSGALMSYTEETVAASSTAKTLTRSRAKRSGSGKKIRKQGKPTGKSGKISKSKTCALKRTQVVEDHVEITPMRSRQPRTTPERIMSRKPLRMNPYYTLTLDSKGKSLNTSPGPRPCSQSSWKTVDTDGTIRTPPPAKMGGAARESSAHGKRKKKKLKRSTNASGASENSQDRPMKTKKKKKVSKTKGSVPTYKAKEPSPLDQKQTPETLVGTEPQDPASLVEPALYVEATDHSDINLTAGIEENQETLISLQFDKFKEISFSNEPQPAPTPPKESVFIPDYNTESDTGNESMGPSSKPSNTSPKSSSRREKCHASDGKIAKPAGSPRKHGVSAKSSPKFLSPKQRSPNYLFSKSPNSGTLLYKQHLGFTLHNKPLIAVGGARPTGKLHPAIRKLGYRPAKLPGKPLAQQTSNGTDASNPEQEEQQKTTDLSDVETSLPLEHLEQCRRAFETYKDIHPELVERSEMSISSNRNKTSVLRKAGPFVVALLIQLFVQYTYH